MKIFLTLLFTIFSSSLAAQVIDSSFYQWTIYEIGEGELEEKKCYMMMRPIKSQTDQDFRDEPYIMITRYQNRRIEELSISAGFEYKLNSKILISVDESRFQLPTNEDKAWSQNKDTDVYIIQKMLKSGTVKVRADSSIGTFAIDEYSTKGIAKSYSRLRTICK